MAEAEAKYTGLLEKHTRETDQLRRMLRTERDRAKSAKSAQLALQAQQGELQTLLRSLLEHVRSKRGFSTAARTHTYAVT